MSGFAFSVPLRCAGANINHTEIEQPLARTSVEETTTEAVPDRAHVPLMVVSPANVTVPEAIIRSAEHKHTHSALRNKCHLFPAFLSSSLLQ